MSLTYMIFVWTAPVRARLSTDGAGESYLLPEDADLQHCGLNSLDAFNRIDRPPLSGPC